MLSPLAYKIALTQIPHIGPVLAKNLLGYCGSAEAVFNEKEPRLLKIPGIGKKHAKLIVDFKGFAKAEAEAEYIEKNNINLLFFSDASYPRHLKHIADAPILLYGQGNIDCNNSYMVGIVGTRKATEQGKEICNQIIADLLPYNCTIVSGLAYGIDVAAHKAAVQNNMQTIGVLAHGLDMLYPAENAPTAKKMLENGGLLTEYPSKTNPDRENFPTRNRIVAGMCDALVVIETDIKGGSMITADIAFSYNRDVFAIPASPSAKKLNGCNWLIKNNKAALIENGLDIATMMGWELNAPSPKIKTFTLPDNLSEQETVIANILQTNALGIDEIARQTNVSLNKVSLTLLELELKGLVKSLPGKVYKLSI